jgi:glycosyltransferase involved in cell wall biosynthesis
LDKVLTIAVPAYNADWCIEKCLLSLIDESVMSSLEVLVIDDGSTDETSIITHRFVERYPDTFRVISKENGGHGSAINTAVSKAAGKYFKVVDADDWIITENLVQFINVLKEKNADVVLTNYHIVDITTGQRQEFITRGLNPNEVYTIDFFSAASTAAFQCVTFHGITYLTSFYRSTGLLLPEKIFYEDQEYATSPLAKAKTVLPLDIFLYQYMVGNAAQSVSDANQVKRMADIEKVIFNVIDCFNNNPDMPEGVKKLYIYKVCLIVKSYYVVALIKKPDRKTGRKDVARIRRLMAKKNAMLVRHTNKDYNIILLMHYLHISSQTWQRIKQSAILKLVYNGGANNREQKRA